MEILPVGAVRSAMPSPFNAASRSKRCLVTPLRGSVIVGPLSVKRAAVEAIDSSGNADLSAAIAPATCGVAWDVPAIVYPPALINAPGASMDRNEVELEKHVILSALVVGSEQAE
jgi:hypothetical protein